MKVCKKCKKHVVNKAKICKYCGSDVSKARIIKNQNNGSKAKDVKKIKEQEDLIKNVSLDNKIVADDKKVQSKEKLEDKKRNKGQILKKCKSKVVELNNKKRNKNNDKIKNKEKDENKSRFKIKSKLNDKKIDEIKKIKFIDRFKLIFKNLKSFFGRFNNFIKNSKVLNDRFSVRILMIFVIGLLVFGIGTYFLVDVYRSVINADNKVVVGEKATTDKIFGMGDLITYKGVDYKVVKVETSKGNSYKAPKEGNQFLIVTVYVKNNTGEKIPYSYKNWTMSNSLGDEETRIFTSVNVDTALYSGDLVIGGIKTGSMVFEQPIKDPKLRMNFYELKKDKKGEDVIDREKKIFSVSVKIPEKKKTVPSQGEKSLDNKTEEKVKAVKTSDQ